MYDDIDFFYATGYDVFFIVRRGCKKGIYKFAQEKLEVISQLHFDDFFDIVQIYFIIMTKLYQPKIHRFGGQNNAGTYL